MTSEELYARLLKFAQECQKLVKKLPKTLYNQEYGRQLIRASGSIGANYIEALEASSKKDFTHKLKICRKESRESNHWLSLISGSNQEISAVQHEVSRLISEAKEILRIFASAVQTSERNKK